ncbi:MAG: alanine:cation symporter family protein, partial [bacterium]|nr:alanine:cation symporter family protein [bacterium]
GRIVKSAVGLEQVAAGGMGYAMQQAMMNGVRRGLFSNEAGMGSAPNAAATADPQPPHPASQGYVQMLGVFIDTIVICSSTAAIILISGQLDTSSDLTGIELTQRALSSEVGAWGGPFVAVAVFLFAFTSIVANYSYAETNLLYLVESRIGLHVFRAIVLGLVLFGSLAKLPLVWALADVAMSLMALLNIVAILLLSKIAISVADNFDRQRQQGERPRFAAASIPRLDGKLVPGIW